MIFVVFFFFRIIVVSLDERFMYIYVYIFDIGFFMEKRYYIYHLFVI
jgi:hypothetical protein